MKIAIIACAVVALAVLVFWLAKRGENQPLVEIGDAGESGEDRDIRQLVEPLSKPTILIKTREGESASYFGGIPPKVSGFQWPHRDSRPMGFLACINLADLPRALDWLPETGRLLFFYDLEEQPWGFDPKDRGGWEVFYSEVQPSPDDTKAEVPPGLKAEFILKTRGMDFEASKLPPSWEEDVLSPLNLTDTEQDELIDYRSSLYGEGASHQIGGYPDPIQSPEMVLECQLVSNGLYCGDSSGYQDPRAEELKDGVEDWRLLLQMDSDDDLDVMWGDVGTVYFWIREDDAKQKDFSKAWLVLQCH